MAQIAQFVLLINVYNWLQDEQELSALQVKQLATLQATQVGAAENWLKMVNPVKHTPQTLFSRHMVQLETAQDLAIQVLLTKL
jgi:hypothetical protein